MSMIHFTENTRDINYPLDPNNDLIPPGEIRPLDEIRTDPEAFKKRYFSLSIQDINQYHKEKLKRWIQVYEKVLGTCYRRIREHVLRDQSFCFFSIPEFIPGFPIFNMTHCTCFMLRKLRQANFTAQYVPPNLLYISWPLEQRYLGIAPPPEQPVVPTPLPVPPRNYQHMNNPRPKEPNTKYISLGPRVESIVESVNKSRESQPVPDNTLRANAFALQEEEIFLHM